MGSPGDMTLKVELDGDTRRLPLQGYGSAPAVDPADMLSAIMSCVCAGFGLEEDEPLTLKYADDEGDMCTLVEATLNDALKLASGGTLKLQARGGGGGGGAAAALAPEARPEVPRRHGSSEAPGRSYKSAAASDEGDRWSSRPEKGKSAKGKGESKGKEKGYSKGKREGEEKGYGKGMSKREGEFVAKVPVDDQEIDLNFNFREKIIGEGAKNVRHLREQTGAQVWLKGEGSSYKEGDTGRESAEPLHLYISAHSQSELDRAVELANDLLSTVLSEYDGWCAGDREPQKGKGKSKGKSKYSSGKGKGKSDRYDDDRWVKRPRTW